LRALAAGQVESRIAEIENRLKENYGQTDSSDIENDRPPETAAEGTAARDSADLRVGGVGGEANGDNA
jgi:hypothetical protein